MKPKREGPFTITVVLGPVTIKTPSNLRIYNIFHATLLQPYKENETYGSNFTEPPPELLKWEEMYEIENILNHWKCRRGYHWQYLIKWKGYPISDTSWEPEQSFLNDGNTLEQYKLRHGLKWLYTMQMASRLKIQRELEKIKEAVDDAMELFMYIKLALALGEEFPTIIGGEQSLWWSRPGYIMRDTSICHKSWDIEFHEFLMVSLHFFGTIDIMYYVAIN